MQINYFHQIETVSLRETLSPLAFIYKNCKLLNVVFFCIFLDKSAMFVEEWPLIAPNPIYFVYEIY